MFPWMFVCNCLSNHFNKLLTVSTFFCFMVETKQGTDDNEHNTSNKYSVELTRFLALVSSILDH